MGTHHLDAYIAFAVAARNAAVFVSQVPTTNLGLLPASHESNVSTHLRSAGMLRQQSGLTAAVLYAASLRNAAVVAINMRISHYQRSQFD